MTQPSADEIVSLFFSTGRILKQKLGLSSPILRLPPAQTETLRLIWEKKQVAMKEVADFLAVTPPSATALIDHLVASGFVLRATAKADRRAVYLSLTAKGETILRQIIKTRCKKLKKMLANLTKKEQLNLLYILRKMFKAN